MSAHALVGLSNSDERHVEAVYVHCDGGPHRLGRLLLNHYDSLADVETILDAGDFHALRESVGLSSHRTHPPVAARDGELWLLAQRDAAEYVYVFDRGWWWSPTAERRLRPLIASDTSDAIPEPLTAEAVQARTTEVLTYEVPPGEQGLLASAKDCAEAFALEFPGDDGADDAAGRWAIEAWNIDGRLGGTGADGEAMEVFVPAFRAALAAHVAASDTPDTSDTVPPHRRSADGVDAGAYTVSEPLTVESVTARALAAQPPASMTKVVALYRDVLGVIAAADRHGLLGALARAALTAVESGRARPRELLARTGRTFGMSRAR